MRSQNLGIIWVFTWRSLYSLPWRSHSVWDPWADAQGTFQAWLAEEITSILFARAQSLEEHRLLVQTWEGLLLTAALPCLLPLMLLPSTVSWSWSSCWRSPGLREGRVLTNNVFQCQAEIAHRIICFQAVQGVSCLTPLILCVCVGYFAPPCVGVGNCTFETVQRRLKLHQYNSAKCKLWTLSWIRGHNDHDFLHLQLFSCL